MTKIQQTYNELIEALCSLVFLFCTKYVKRVYVLK